MTSEPTTSLREERRQSLRQDARAAWAEYRATGRHVTAEEADAWLACIEAGEDAEPPSSHDWHARGDPCRAPWQGSGVLSTVTEASSQYPSQKSHIF